MAESLTLASAGNAVRDKTDRAWDHGCHGGGQLGLGVPRSGPVGNHRQEPTQSRLEEHRVRPSRAGLY